MRVQRTAKLVDNRPHFATICGNLLLLSMLLSLLLLLLLLLLSHLPNSLAGNLASLHMIKSTPPPRPQLVSHATPSTSPLRLASPLLLPVATPLVFPLSLSIAHWAVQRFFRLFLSVFQIISSLVFLFFLVLFLVLVLALVLFLLFFFGLVFSFCNFYLLLRTSRKNFRCMQFAAAFPAINTDLINKQQIVHFMVCPLPPSSSLQPSLM